MMRVRSLTAVAMVAGVIAVAAAAYAQGPGIGGPGGRFRHGGFDRGFGRDLPLRALALTDAQRQQVREITERHRTNVQSAGEQLRKAFEAQRAAAEALPVDEGAIRSTTEALAAAQTAMAIERAQIRAEIVQMLTPEQTEKLKQWQAERQARMKERLERRQQRQQQRQQRPPQQQQG